MRTLPAREVKSREVFTYKNALTDQYLEPREPSQAEVGTALAINDDDWHFAALETTLKHKSPATTNTTVSKEKFQVEVIHGGNRNVVEF